MNLCKFLLNVNLILTNLSIVILNIKMKFYYIDTEIDREILINFLSH
jgi:hypothetical protein